MSSFGTSVELKKLSKSSAIVGNEKLRRVSRDLAKVSRDPEKTLFFMSPGGLRRIQLILPRK